MSKILIILIFLFLSSCNKKEDSVQESETQKKETTEEDSDSVLTSEETFSSSLVQGILGDEDELELQLYLEEQIYPLVSKSNKITLDRVSSSLYLFTYEENGTMKNFMIQKFYNPIKDEFTFDKFETKTNSVKQFMK